MRAHSGGRLGLGLTALVFSLILLPSLTGRSLLAHRDMLQNYWPTKAAYWTRPGDLLLKWNPDLFGGMSYLADPVQQPSYLPNLAFRIFGVPAVTGIPLVSDAPRPARAGSPRVSSRLRLGQDRHARPGKTRLTHTPTDRR
jgi:hypothetical protein